MSLSLDREIAVLMTCHNRRELTLRCLRSLFAQHLPDGYSLRVVLTDDGSTDGTGEAVRHEFAAVTIVPGDGSLYWCGGTTAAWNVARPAGFYLWLNDDVQLRAGALQALVDTFERSGDNRTIVAGATVDPLGNKTVTGGMRRESWYKCRLLEPSDRATPCDSFNGNIVLVPRAAELLLGGLDPAYTHYFGDADYGIRARQAGIPVLLAPGHLGECRLNSRCNTSFDAALSMRQRWARMLGPKGYRRPDQWWAFVRAHAPRPKVIFWLAPYVVFGLECLLGGRWIIRRDINTDMTAA
jgi:GT2 family glycosyltransferase